MDTHFRNVFFFKSGQVLIWKSINKHTKKNKISVYGYDTCEFIELRQKPSIRRVLCNCSRSVFCNYLVQIMLCVNVNCSSHAMCYSFCSSIFNFENNDLVNYHWEIQGDAGMHVPHPNEVSLFQCIFRENWPNNKLASLTGWRSIWEILYPPLTIQKIPT